MNDYQRITDEIFDYIMDDNVISKIDKIFLVVLGDKNKKLVLPTTDKIEIIYSSENMKEFEFVTLELLRDFCIENPDNNVCYLHLKGLGSNNGNECLNDWRKYMLYFLLTKIDNVLDSLKHNVSCGVDLRSEPTLHYSGNFWWGNTSYIATLPEVRNLPLIISERHKCEFWICSDKDKKHESLWDCGIDVYERHLHRYEEKKYIK